jgi:hypothetical protein
MENSKYSAADFESKLGLFESYINEVTLRDQEASSLEQRRKLILGTEYFRLELKFSVQFY